MQSMIAMYAVMADESIRLPDRPGMDLDVANGVRYMELAVAIGRSRLAALSREERSGWLKMRDYGAVATMSFPLQVERPP